MLNRIREKLLTPGEVIKQTPDVLTGFLTLGEVPCQILELLGAGNYVAKVARTLGISKQRVDYWKNRFLTSGLLTLQCRDVIKLYQPTPMGQKILTGSERGFGCVVVLEDYPVKFGIVCDVVVGVDWRKLGEPRNWVKFGVVVGGCRVVRTSKSVIIHPGQIRGFDPFELLHLSGVVVERVKTKLESFGMVLDDVGVPLRKPIFQVFDPIAKHLARYCSVHVDGVGGVDKSPPSCKAHLEFEGAELCRDYLVMPAMLRSIESKLETQHTEVLDRLSALERDVEFLMGKSIEKPKVMVPLTDPHPLKSSKFGAISMTMGTPTPRGGFNG